MTNKNRNIFPKWTNYLPTIIGGVVTVTFVCIVFIIWYWFSPKHLNVGYQPTQPIPYSHELHVGQLGIDCRYCHTNVETAAHANIPATETCLNCHKNIKKDSPEIMKLHKSFAENKPIEWVNVHQLPEYAYFNHSRHVNSGIGCVTCHGRVDQMEVVYQDQPLSMSWCLDCHRNPDKHLRPKSKITSMDWVAKDQDKLGEKLKELYHISPREDCSACHR